jgi:hypothetical protein
MEGQGVDMPAYLDHVIPLDAPERKGSQDAAQGSEAGDREDMPGEPGGLLSALINELN